MAEVDVKQGLRAVLAKIEQASSKRSQVSVADIDDIFGRCFCRNCNVSFQDL
jgi:hypothetical protein